MSEQNANDIALRNEVSPHYRVTARASDSVCAIVVAYYPDDKFDERVQSLFPQVATVVVVDNTPREDSEPSCKSMLQDAAQIHFIRNRSNVGIAAALNQGLDHALKEGFPWILTLDQDTQCFPDMVDTLLKVSRSSKPTPMVIGGNYFDPRNGRAKIPIGRSEDFLEQKTVITSGSLIDAGLAAAIGGFRTDYFIDQVDHEFCLRSRAHGHKVVISRKLVMTHSVGQAGGVRLPFLGVLPNHPPLRKYYIARNTVVTITKYWRREPGWCLRRLIRLLLGLGEMAVLEKNRISNVCAFFAGCSDGIRHRMGVTYRDYDR